MVNRKNVFIYSGEGGEIRKCIIYELFWKICLKNYCRRLSYVLILVVLGW